MNLASIFVAPWKLCFGGFHGQRKLSAADVMIGAAGLAHQVLVDAWPVKARIILHPQDREPLDLTVIKSIGELPSPTFAFAVLQERYHWMLYASMPHASYGFDGTDNPHLHKLCQSAQDRLRLHGFAPHDITFPRKWIQTDGWSCGYHVLHVIRWLLQCHSKRNAVDMLENMDARSLEQVLSNAARQIGVTSPGSRVLPRLALDVQQTIREKTGFGLNDGMRLPISGRFFGRLAEAVAALQPYPKDKLVVVAREISPSSAR